MTLKFNLKNVTQVFCFMALALSFAVLPPALLIGNNYAVAHEVEPKKPVFSITGRGTVTAEPDIAYISSGVVSEEKTAEAALSDNSNKMQAIFNAMLESGIERKNIQTANFSVTPIYVYHNPKKGEEQRPPRITGYRVNNSFSVKVTDLEKTGEVLTKVVNLGSNQLGNIRFDISDKAELLDVARTKAVKDAIRKAEIYMKAAGTELGDILVIREVERGRPRPVLQAARTVALAEAAPAVPVAAGEGSLAIEVQISWELEQ